MNTGSLLSSKTTQALASQGHVVHQVLKVVVVLIIILMVATEPLKLMAMTAMMIGTLLSAKLILTPPQAGEAAAEVAAVTAKVGPPR